jgi:DNA-binding transcriptional LysR family regulator
LTIAGDVVYSTGRHRFHNQRLCMDLTSALRTFARIVERGSMTAAARDLGVSQPAVSKLLRGLEAHLGVRLLERNARALRPTAQGLLLYKSCGRALATIDAAIEGVRNNVGAIDGHLRLHGPVCISERHLYKIVMDFQDIYPNVSIELIIENQPVDLIRANVDVALRMGPPTDQSLIVRRIGSSRRVLVASPEYLARQGYAPSVASLADHDIIVTDASLSARGTLPLCHGEAIEEIVVHPILKTNNAQVLVAALKAGRGIGTAQVLLVSDELSDGRLARVLPQYEIESSELFLTYPSAKYLRPLVRAFIDFAAPALQRINGIVEGGRRLQRA